VVSEIPKTSVGKFDKKALRRAYAHDDLDVIELD
jgi:fatty-acyl-CoA synthase